MTWGAGVFDNFEGVLLTPPGIDVRKLVPSDILGRKHYPLQGLAVKC